MKTTDQVTYFPVANYAGGGFDIYGKYNINSSFITPLFDPLKAKTVPFSFLGKDYVLPEYLSGTVNTSAYFQEDTVSNRDSFQNSLATQASVKGSYGAFSGQMEAAYSSQLATSSSYDFSYRNFYSRLGAIDLLLNDPQRYLTDYFMDRVSALPSELNTNTLAVFADFFDDFGIYYVSQLVLGGSLEYYVAVSKSSSIAKQDISASVKVDYNSLFASAGLSADVKNSKEWQNYQQNRSTKIMIKGGDPTFAALLGNVDTNNANQQSTDYFNQWLGSLKSEPAVVDFKLSGIWGLCGDKQKVVEQAFNDYGRRMRPRLSVQLSTTDVPTITLDQDIRPAQPPAHNHGYQLVVLDRTNISAQGVQWNQYYSFPEGYDWWEQCQRMYTQMLTDLKGRGFLTSNYVLVLASFGMYDNAPPTSDIFGALVAAGAGSKLQYWLEGASPGSKIWGTVSYTLIGVPGFGRNTGIEAYLYNGNTVNLDALFYRAPYQSLYSLAPGEDTAPVLPTLGAMHLTLASPEHA